MMINILATTQVHMLVEGGTFVKRRVMGSVLSCFCYEKRRIRIRKVLVNIEVSVTW